MICNICGGTESYIQDGIAYCRECSEQIKGSIDEDAGEESFSKKSLLSSPSSKKEKTEKGVPLAPWLTTDAYNLILFKQVSALIKLGCSEKLKTVVLSLWARYLQKCESAFGLSDRKEGFLPRLSLYPSKRDIELLYGKGLSTNLKWKRKKGVTPKDGMQKITQKSPKTEPMDSATSISEVSSDESLESESLHNSTKKSRKRQTRFYYSTHAKNLKKTRHTAKGVGVAQEFCVSHMTLSKTLSFCYLGLLYTEDELLLFDLIRLVCSGAVPFIDVARHFPSSMQLHLKDYNLFIKLWHAPDVKRILATSAQLIDFLQLPKFKQRSLLPIAIRFVKDLNLPCDLIPVLKHLISKIEKVISKNHKLSTPYRCSLPSYDAQALSVIAVAMKMLFVLDGKFEMEHSAIMMKLNSISKDQTYFVWKEWYQQMRLKKFLFIKSYTTKANAMNYLDMLCADRINGNYPVVSIHEELTTLLSSSSKNIYSTRKDLISLFDGLTDKTSIVKNPTSYPLRYELQFLIDHWKELPLFKDTENIDFSFISKDFSYHKLYYRPSLTTDEPTNLLFASLYESVKLHHIAETEDYLENIIRTTSRYWYAKLLNQHSNNKKWVNCLPSSFKWLVNFMSKYLQMEPIIFYKEFVHIESILTEM